MALWVCLKCTTKYAVGLFRCPRCHGTDFVEDGQPMPKITRHGGASDKTTPVPESAPMAAVSEEESSPGSSSSASSPKPSMSSEQSKPHRPKPARTTGSRSAKGRTESSTASGTAGDQGTGTSTPDDEGERP